MFPFQVLNCKTNLGGVTTLVSQSRKPLPAPATPVLQSSTRLFIPLFFPPPPLATGPCKQSAEISQGVEYFYKPAHCDEYIKALLEAAQAFMG